MRQRLARLRRPMEEVGLVVGSAIAVSFLLDALVNPPDTAREMIARITGSTARIAFALLLGLYLGKRAWPRRGTWVGRKLLARATHGRAKPLLFLTDRPDFTPSTPRRVFEVTGFAAGSTILLTAILSFAGASGFVLRLPISLFVLLAVWGAFLLVPYWTFARMGLRRVDAVRWLVEPMSRRYAQRLRLSNGALLVLSLGATINLAFRAGFTGDAAIVEALRYIGQLTASIVVVAAAGVAYYNRAERGVFLELEKEALAVGIKDGRALNDGDFLPRLGTKDEG